MRTFYADKGLNRPVVLTIVCAMRNVAHCVEGFLDSYRQERTGKTELILIDGASTDRTWELLLRNKDVIDVAISDPDTGIYDAWNKALPKCRGRYVSFIGADDRIASGAIDSLIAACENMKSDPHVIAGFNVLTRNGVPVELLGGTFDESRLTRMMTIAHVMSAHRLSWLICVDGFDASYRSSGDYELLLRERAHLEIEVINTILAYMEDGGTSRTSLRPFFENYRARQRNGVPRILCLALLARALMGFVARKLGLRR